MTDTFMSGWGGAVKNRISKFCIACDSSVQAHNLAYQIKNERDSEMRYVNVRYGAPPKYPTSRYHTAYTHITHCTRWEYAKRIKKEYINSGKPLPEFEENM